jgi:hypothetical protein
MNGFLRSLRPAARLSPPRRKICRRAFETHLALLEEDGAFGERDRDVHRLLDQHDGRSLSVDRANDLQETLHY